MKLDWHPYTKVLGKHMSERIPTWFWGRWCGWPMTNAKQNYQQHKDMSNNKKYSHFMEHPKPPSEYRLSDPDDSHSAWTGTCHRAPDVGAKRGWAVPCRGTGDQISEPSWPQQGSCRECLKGRRPSKNCTSCLRPSWCDQGDLYPDLVSLGFHTYLWKYRPVTPDLRETEQTTKYHQMHGSLSSQSTNIFLRWR